MPANDAPYRRISFCFCVRGRYINFTLRSFWSRQLPGIFSESHKKITYIALLLGSISTNFLPLGSNLQSTIGRKNEQIQRNSHLS